MSMVTAWYWRAQTSADQDVPMSSDRPAVPSMTIWLVYSSMCLIFGTTFLAIRIGAQAGLPAYLAAGLRFTTAGLLLMVFSAARRVYRRMWENRQHPVVPTNSHPNPTTISIQPPVPHAGGYLWRTMVLGTLIIGISFALTYRAADSIGSGLIAQLQAVSPVVVALLSMLLLGARFSRWHAAGLTLGVLGVLGLVGSAGAAGSEPRLGAMLALTAEVSYALGTIWYRRAFARGTDPITTNGFSMLWGGLLLLGLAAARGQTMVEASPAAVFSLIYLIVAGSIGGHTMYLWLVNAVSPLFASTWLFVSPVIATVLGALVLGERVGVANLAGAAAVLAGVYAVQTGERMRSAGSG